MLQPQAEQLQPAEDAAKIERSFPAAAMIWINAWPISIARWLVEKSKPQSLGKMPTAPAPQGARPRLDIRPRVLAALTSVSSTPTEIAEHAGLPGRERAIHATRALMRLEADGMAVSETRRNWTWWRSAAAPPASARPGRDPGA